MGAGARFGGPDVEVEAVVAGDRGVGQVPGEGLGVRRFGGRGAVGARVADAVPGLGGQGRTEPARAEGRGRVGDAPEDGDAVLVPAAYRPVHRGDHGVRLA